MTQGPAKAAYIWCVAFSLAFVTGACSKYTPLGTCPEGRSVSDRDLVLRAVRKLVLQTSGEIPPETIHYRSVAEFFARNPDCCFITRPRDYSGDPLALPLAGELEVAIRYRRAHSGEAPYAIRYVTFGPCSTDMEESEPRLTTAQYEASRHWRWNWRVH
jgi:hypothetical protein